MTGALRPHIFIYTSSQLSSDRKYLMEVDNTGITHLK